MTLVAIPWQPHLFVHPDMLSRLEHANTILGHNVTLGSGHSPDGAPLAGWRDKAETDYLWNGWVKRLPGFSPASNPNWGPRSHQRGVGADLYPYSPAVLNACHAAGIQVNGVAGEPWHVQLPNFMSYPIIETNTSPAGGGGTPVPAPVTPPTPVQEDDMYDAAAEARLTSLIREVVTRERAKLVFDAGDASKGTSYTFETSPRVVLIKITDGFIYPLTPVLADRPGQVASLQNTGYTLIGINESLHPVGLATPQFNNQIEMANGHLRRIAAAVLSVQAGGAPASTTTKVPAGSAPTRELPVDV